MTIQELRKERMQAMKEKNQAKANVLMMLIDTIGKLAKEDRNDINFNYIQKGLKKYMKQVEDAINNGVESAKEELEILKEYAEKILPKELSDNELKEKIKEILNKSDNPNVGFVMKELKQIPGVNMKKASQFIKEML